MSLLLNVPDEIASAVEQMAQQSGQKPERLLLDALRAHFPPVPAELQAEFEALEAASDEDFARLEKLQDFHWGE